MPIRYLVMAPGALRVFTTATRAKTYARNYLKRMPCRGASGILYAEVTRTRMNKAGVFRDYGKSIAHYEKTCGRRTR